MLVCFEGGWAEGERGEAGSIRLSVSLSLNSSLLKEQAESNSASVLFSVNKSWLSSNSRFYKHRHALVARCTVEAQSHMHAD